VTQRTTLFTCYMTATELHPSRPVSLLPPMSPKNFRRHSLYASGTRQTRLTPAFTSWNIGSSRGITSSLHGPYCTEIRDSSSRRTVTAAEICLTWHARSYHIISYHCSGLLSELSDQICVGTANPIRRGADTVMGMRWRVCDM
jgi:hypothetical protein